MAQLPNTLGALKRSPFASAERAYRSVKDEIRANLLARIAAGGPLFTGVLGYDETVMPQIVNALLSRHNFILLGLRGQAKSRILRSLTTLLDDTMPIVAGSEINDSPFQPISKFARDLIATAGDDTPIAYVDRDQRFVEKLATPDVTVADLIGDLDPIKAARGGHILSDELTIHYGMLPRANRGIFALNELPDLAGKVQVGLFNIMQEGDVQIKGYPIRLPLDVLLCFAPRIPRTTPRAARSSRRSRIASGGEIISALSGKRSHSASRSPSRKRGPLFAVRSRREFRRCSRNSSVERIRVRSAHGQTHRPAFGSVAAGCANQRAREC